MRGHMLQDFEVLERLNDQNLDLYDEEIVVLNYSDIQENNLFELFLD